MHKYVYLIFLILFTNVTRSQNAHFTWAKGMGGAMNSDVGRAIALDAMGNVYTTGSFYDVVDFDPGPGTYTMATMSGANNAFVVKLDANGNFIWAKQFGGTLACLGMGITVDNLNNVYFTGIFNSTVDFDPGPATYTITSLGVYDAFIVKLDPSGGLAWVKAFGANSQDYSESICLDASNNVYTTGYFANTVDFDPGPGIYNMTSITPQLDIFILKLDLNGNFVWAKSMGGPTNDYGRSIKIDLLGNVCSTGFYNSTGDFDPGPTTYTLAPTTTTSNEIYVSKLDASGNFIWAKSMGGPSDDVAEGIAIDGMNNIITIGEYGINADFDPGPGTYTMTPQYIASVFVSKLDPFGNFIWVKNLAGSQSGDAGTSLTTDASNNIYATGNFNLTVDFDPGPGSYSLTSNGITDCFICKLNSSGGFVWARNIGGWNFDSSYDIVIDATENIHLTGNYNQVVDFDPGPLTYTMTGNGDVFIEKFCQMNDPVISANGPTSFCEGGNVVLTSSPANSYSWSTGPISQSVTISATGNYFVIATNSAGCAGSATVLVVANPIPTIAVNSGSICLGNSFTISPSGAATYTFLNGGPIVSPTATTSYSVVGSNSIGCISASAAICNVIINSLPLPTLTLNSGTLCSGNSFNLSPSGASTYTYFNTGPIVTPTSSSTYTVIGTNSLGCVSQPAVSSVTVYITPTISVNNGTLCVGQAFTISPSGAYSYTVLNGSLTVTPAWSMNYLVTGTSSLGCGAYNLATCSVTVYQLPFVSVSGTPSLLCAGNSATLNAMGAFSYNWNPGGSGYLITVSPTVTTTYTITGFSTIGCSNTAVYTQSVDVCTYAKDINSVFESFLIYPNPVNGNIKIRTSYIDNFDIAVYSADGKHVFSQTALSNDKEVNLEGLAKGLYLVQLKDRDNRTISKRLIID